MLFNGVSTWSQEILNCQAKKSESKKKKKNETNPLYGCLEVVGILDENVLIANLLLLPNISPFSLLGGRGGC